MSAGMAPSAGRGGAVFPKKPSASTSSADNAREKNKAALDAKKAETNKQSKAIANYTAANADLTAAKTLLNSHEKNASEWIASHGGSPSYVLNLLVTSQRLTVNKKAKEVEALYNKAYPNKAVNRPPLYSSKNILNPGYVSPNPVGGGSNKPTTPPKSITTPYKYNPPLVKEAYLSQGNSTSPSPQGFSMRDSRYLGSANAKGRIVMSNTFPSLVSGMKKATPKGGGDPNTLYGFRFSYNPNAVSMTWAPSDKFNPFWLNSGENQAVPYNMMGATISFKLLLNRQLDMRHVGPTGLQNVAASNAGNGPDSVYDNRLKLGELDTSAKALNPYPSVVSNEDLAGIYEKGTMYDLDFLFRALGGELSRHTSFLTHNKTADSGWLNPIPVELSLGGGSPMKYLVRITSLSVDHLLFDERMVPIYSEVSLTAARYFDGFDAIGENALINSELLNNQ